MKTLGWVWRRYDEYSRPVDAASLTKENLEDYAIFRDIDRARLTKRSLDRHFNFEVFFKAGYMDSIFFLHQPKNLVTFHDWSSFSNVYKSNQPIDHIREYFGEDVAMYCAWMSLYGVALHAPSFLGLLLFSVSMFFDPGLRFKSPWLNAARCAYGLFISCWTTWFQYEWANRESYLRLKWGLEVNSDLRIADSVRPMFKGDMLIKDPVRPSRWIWQETPWKRKMRRIASSFVFFLLLLICVVCINGDVHEYAIDQLGVGSWMDSLEGGLGKLTSMVDLASIFTAVCVFIFDYLFTSVTATLVGFENHKFDSDHSFSRVLKVFTFKSLDYYSPLFYIAFLKSYVDPCPNSLTGHCLRALRRQLVALFVIDFFLTLVEVASPLMMYALKKAKIKDGASRESVQASQETYTDTTEDMEEMMTQFGLVTLFSMILPCIPTLAMLSTHFEIRADAFKIVKAHRRPFPKETRSMGAWNDVTNVLSLITFVVNIALCVFATFGRDHSLRKQLAICSILMLAGFSLRELVAGLAKQERVKTIALRKRMQLVLHEAIWGDIKKPGVNIV